MVLPNRAQVEFRNGESIRVTLSRKYSRSGVEELVKEAGLSAVKPAPVPEPRRSRPTLFGLEVALLQATPTAPEIPTPTVADELWPKTPVRR